MWQVTLSTELLNVLVNNDSRKGDLLQKVIILRGYSLFQVIPLQGKLFAGDENVKNTLGKGQGLEEEFLLLGQDRKSGVAFSTQNFLPVWSKICKDLFNLDLTTLANWAI